MAITSHVQLTFCIVLQCISIKEFGVRVAVYGIHVAIVKDLVSYTVVLNYYHVDDIVHVYPMT